jgi:hypothetical protein
MAFQRSGIVAISAGDIQNHEAVNGSKHLKKGEGFAVLPNGQAFCLAIGVRNSIIVCHNMPSQYG